MSSNFCNLILVYLHPCLPANLIDPTACKSSIILSLSPPSSEPIFYPRLGLIVAISGMQVNARFDTKLVSRPGSKFRNCRLYVIYGSTGHPSIPISHSKEGRGESSTY
ncbi:hypothetical protein F5Y02DRAFT_55760 [Annulohypoxylon stygium]|nr:hypothetical protein F5Y02DRAFT_55760 [Annulohypoxylon stygium]